jgi:hypothetical protein
MSNEYEFGRATGKCAVTQKPFQEGEQYYVVLIEEADGFVRRDYSVEGWSGPPEGSFCFWRGRTPIKDKKGRMAVDLGVLLNLFQRLENVESRGKQHFRFVLALLLMRKRLLRLDESVREDGREFWQMRVAADQSLHRVLNPELSQEEIALLSAQLSALLSGEVQAFETLESDGDPDPSVSTPAEETTAVE